jgi:uncharacterized protein YecT (DUF1311 family)
MNTPKIIFRIITIGGILGITFLTMPKKLFAESINPNCQSPETQTDMNICAGLDAQKADQQLNQVYKQLKAGITDPQSVKELINAETAWIKFRDNDCKFTAGLYRGGSIAPMMYSLCVENLTKQRTEQLKGYLQNN